MGVCNDKLKSVAGKRALMVSLSNGLENPEINIMEVVAPSNNFNDEPGAGRRAALALAVAETVESGDLRLLIDKLRNCGC